MQKKHKLIFTVLILFTFFLYSCNNKVVTKENYLLDTIVKLQVYGNNAEKATNKAMETISYIDDVMSPSKPESDVYKINSNAGKSFVKVSDDTFKVIKKSLEYSKLSNGSFDITVGPLVKLWGIGTDKAKVPSHKEIQQKLKLINYNDVILDEKNKTVKLKKPNEAIDLGGIAKGYAADKVKEVLEKEGIKTAFINLGGNIIALGNKSDGSLWNIGIQDPSNERGKYFATIKVSHKSIVSSGNYERFFEKNNTRYHHILDTKTGYPSESGVVSSTIISDYSIDGDALSTITFMLGVNKGMDFIKSLNGVEAVFVTKDKKVYITPGLKNNFKLTNKEYTYEEGR